MRKNKFLVLFLLNFLLCSSTICAQNIELRNKIEEIIQSKKANVGFAMLAVEDKDSISVNGHEHYTMQSVYKFHLAVAVLNLVDQGKLRLDQYVFADKNDLLP